MTDFSDYESLSAPEYATLEKVVDILFPGEADGIGAVSAGALKYIDGVLAGRAAYLTDTYRAGVLWLHDRARGYGHDRFDDLSRDFQEAIIDEVMSRTQAFLVPLDAPAKGRGSAGAVGEERVERATLDLVFMTAVWQHTREGLFGDPRHGGNKEGMVWKWLGYNGPQLNGYTDSEILENEMPKRPLRFADDWRNHRG